MRSRRDRIRKEKVKRVPAPTNSISMKGGVVKTSYVPKSESAAGEIKYRWDVINHIIKRFGYTRYLEIGVCGFDLEGNPAGGENFKRIQCEYKDGVDPVECESVSHVMSSDEFFSMIGGNDWPEYDAIFIDGEHIYEQIQRDIDNALSHLANNGTLFIHDAYPNKDYFVDKHIIGGGRGSVWKNIAELFFTRNDLDVWTLKLDNSIAVIRKREESRDLPSILPYSDGRAPSGVTFAKYEFDAMSFEQIQSNIDMMVNIITTQQFKLMVEVF